MGILKSYAAHMENKIETAQAQNEFMNDLSVNDGIVKKLGTEVANTANITTAFLTAPLPGPTLRTTMDVFRKKDEKYFDRNAVKAINHANITGEAANSTVEDRKKAYGSCERGQDRIYDHMKALHDEYDGVSVPEDVSDSTDDLDGP